MRYPFLICPVFVADTAFRQPVYSFPPTDDNVYLLAGQSRQSPWMPYGRQAYPVVDPAAFHQSAESLESLMEDGKTILAKLHESESFAAEVMDAAQKNDKEKVKQLMESTGIQGSVTTHFNPDLITIQLFPDDKQENCCKLSMGLKWK